MKKHHFLSTLLLLGIFNLSKPADKSCMKYVDNNIFTGIIMTTYVALSMDRVQQTPSWFGKLRWASFATAMVVWGAFNFVWNKQLYDQCVRR